MCVWNHSLFQLDFYTNGCAVYDSNQDNIRSLKRVDFLMRGIKGLLFDCMAQHENIIFYHKYNWEFFPVLVLRFNIN